MRVDPAVVEAIDRDRVREAFEDRLPDDHDLDQDRWVDLREREVDRYRRSYPDDEEIERRARQAHRRLLDHRGDDLVLERAREIAAGRRTDHSGPKRSSPGLG